MDISVSYQKRKVLEALRYHFIKQQEIKTLLIIVNFYAIITAILLYYKKIRPELFLLGSILWILLMIFFWYLLPILFYRKTQLFKFDWVFNISTIGASLNSEKGTASWEWTELSHYFESPHFFHFYFGPKSFFIVPKDSMNMDFEQALRGYLKSV